jgi:hypothetical protein
MAVRREIVGGPSKIAVSAFTEAFKVFLVMIFCSLGSQPTYSTAVIMPVVM